MFSLTWQPWTSQSMRAWPVSIPRHLQPLVLLRQRGALQPSVTCHAVIEHGRSCEAVKVPDTANEDHLIQLTKQNRLSEAVQQLYLVLDAERRPSRAACIHILQGKL